MHTTVYMIRLIFTVISIVIASAFTTSTWPGEFSAMALALGVMLGIISSLLLFLVERAIKKIDLRSFNLSILGLFFGYLMASLVMMIVSAVIEVGQIQVEENIQILLKTGVYLISVYVAMMLTACASEEFHLAIPFVKFHAAKQQKRDILIDQSALLDARLVDLATSGLLDHHLIVPRFVLKECYESLENVDESNKCKARQALEVLKKLEGIDALAMRYIETDFPDMHDSFLKLIRLARLMDANILSADMNRIQQASVESAEGVRIINLNALSHALKPLTQSGEVLEIKIQRYGKEAGQGVGYLDDGTMVVVNGGADFVGRTIKTHVLSVKHTTSGRMIFCNAEDEDNDIDPHAARTTAESYFALETR